jgi:hypothetical protein
MNWVEGWRDVEGLTQTICPGRMLPWIALVGNQEQTVGLGAGN